MTDNEILDNAKTLVETEREDKLYYINLFLVIRALQNEYTDHVYAFKQAVRCVVSESKEEPTRVNYKDIFELPQEHNLCDVSLEEINKYERNVVRTPKSVLGQLIWLEALLAAGSIKDFPDKLNVVRQRFWV